MGGTRAEQGRHELCTREPQWVGATEARGVLEGGTREGLRNPYLLLPPPEKKDEVEHPLRNQ